MRAWPLGNGLDSSRIHANTSLIDEKAKIFDLGLKELAFLRVSIKLSPSETFDNELQVFHVFLFVGREDKDIVKVNYTEYVNVALERIVNIYLEGGRGIS